MHTATTLLALAISVNAFPQSGWTEITDLTNPIVTFNSPGIFKGAAWVDFDNDGDIDLYAAPNHLFVNHGFGTFSILPTALPSGNTQFAVGTSWADLNNDGNIDCIRSGNPSAIFLGDGGGIFTEVTSQADSLDSSASWGCAIGNLDGDAYLDLIFVHAAGFHQAPQIPCRLYRNSGAFSPELIRGYPFTDSLGPYTVPFWSDYDLDNDMDLFIASGPAGTPGLDPCYRNMTQELGTDTLYRMTSELFTEPQDGQCYNFIDADNDGDMDLCISNFNGATTRFYRNMGAGVYSSEITPFTNAIPRLSNTWGDYDNDGDLDVIMASNFSTLKLYLNDGSGQFTLATNSITAPANTTGVVNGDMDNDGDLDVFIYGQDVAKALFRNDSVAFGNHWVNIRLEGVQSNRSAIGAIVRVEAIINGSAVTQLREVNAQSSFMGQNDLRVHVGLGDAVIIDQLTVQWPSGTMQTFPGLQADQFYHLQEGGTISTGINSPMKNDVTFSLYPNPTEAILNVRWSNTGGQAEWSIVDPVGRTVRQGKVTREAFTVPTDDLSNNLYQFVLSSNGSSTSKPFTVQH